MAELSAAPSSPSVPGRCLLVLGMHRSGTSALTRVLNLLGAALPRQLLPAQTDNPLGFWEGYQFVRLHDEALARAGLRWFDPAPVPAGFFASKAASGVARNLAEMIETDFADAPLYAVKDPRMCRLVPLWRQTLDRLGSPIIPILAVRDPRDVARSMMARNPLPVQGCHMLWLRHVLEAEVATRDLPRTIVSYDELLGDWRSVVDRLTEEHHIQWPERTPATEAAIDQFLTPTLRHHRDRPSSDEPPEIEREWSRPVHLALAKADDRVVVDRVRGEIERNDQIYGPSFHLTTDWTLPRVPELIAGLVRAKHEIAQLRERAKQFGERVARRESELSMMADVIVHVRQHWAARYNDLIGRYNDLTGRYNDVLASTSWRLTSPLRQLMHRVKGGAEPPPVQQVDWPDAVAGSDLIPSVSGELTPIVDHMFPADWDAIMWSGLWQPEYYLATYPDAAGSRDPLDHYLETGAALGHNPNPWFDTRYYSSDNPRLVSSGANPLVDYIRHGAWEGPDPHPSFKTARYLDLYPQLRAGHMTPLGHFLRYELPAGAPDQIAGTPPDFPRALYALAPLDPDDGWMWQRLLRAGALIPRTGSNLDVATDLFGEPHRAKLLFASHELSRTGAPLVLLALLERFSRHFDAEMIVFSDRGGDLVEAFAVHAHVLLGDAYLPFSAGGGIADIPTIIAKLAGPKPLVGFCNTANTEHYGRCFKQAGIPVIFLVHETATPYSETQVERLFETADTLVAVSMAARQTLIDKIGHGAERTIIIPPGLLKPELLGAETMTSHESIRKELELPSKARIVLTCGTMDLRKGVDVFFQVARRVIRSSEPDIYFVWVGGGAASDRTLPAWWARHDAALAELGTRIRFVGERVDTAPWYLAADLFLLTSREDPMPCVVIEAMAAGLSVIAFRGAGGAPEAIGEAGIVVTYADIDAMAEATTALLNDLERRRRLGGEASRRVRELYGFEEYFERVSGLVPELASIRKPR